MQHIPTVSSLSVVLCCVIIKCSEINTSTSNDIAVDIRSTRNFNFRSLSGCSSGFIYNVSTIVDFDSSPTRPRSEIECAIQCKKDVRCVGYNALIPVGNQIPDDGDGDNSCELIGGAQPLSCQSLVDKPHWKFKYASCDKPKLSTTSEWELSYSTDMTGRQCHGSLETLKDRVMEGKKVAVFIQTPGVRGSIPVGSVSVPQEMEITTGGDVCVHLPFTVHLSSWSQVLSTDTRLFRKVCSTGKVQEWTSDNGAPDEAFRPVEWYTGRATPGSTLVENTVGYGIKLWKALEGGEEATLMTNSVSSGLSHIYLGAAYTVQAQNGSSTLSTFTYTWGFRPGSEMNSSTSDNFLQLSSFFSDGVTSDRFDLWALSSNETIAVTEKTQHRVFLESGWRLVYTSTSSVSSNSSPRSSSELDSVVDNSEEIMETTSSMVDYSHSNESESTSQDENMSSKMDDSESAENANETKSDVNSSSLDKVEASNTESLETTESTTVNETTATVDEDVSKSTTDDTPTDVDEGSVDEIEDESDSTQVNSTTIEADEEDSKSNNGKAIGKIDRTRRKRSAENSVSSDSDSNSTDELLSSIRGGHRVRLAIHHEENKFYFNADHIIISPDGLVTAQVLSGDLTGAQTGELKWHLVRSDGVWVVYTVRLPHFTMMKKIYTDAVIRWFVDTKQYQVVLETDNGEVIRGSASDLPSQGAAVHHLRFQIQDKNETGTEHYYSTDSLILGPSPEEGVSALGMRSIAVSETSEQKSLQGSGSWTSAGKGLLRVAMVTSQGKIYSWDAQFDGSLENGNIITRVGSVIWYVGI